MSDAEAASAPEEADLAELVREIIVLRFRVVVREGSVHLEHVRIEDPNDEAVLGENRRQAEARIDRARQAFGELAPHIDWMGGDKNLQEEARLFSELGYDFVLVSYNENEDTWAFEPIDRRENWSIAVAALGTRRVAFRPGELVRRERDG